MVKSQSWVLIREFIGVPKESDFKLVEEELPALKDREMLCEAVYLSVDPYMRYVDDVGSVMIGQQVAKVTETKHADFPVGTLVLVYSGWRTHSVVNGNDTGPARFGSYRLRKVTDQLGDLDPSVALGIMGMPGATAYFGVTEMLKAKEGETLLVNCAAGAVGSTVGQLGKIMGCRVIGCSSRKEKTDWLERLGFDYVFNYKECDLDVALEEGAPEGIDCLFDNVGGSFSRTVVNYHMKQKGRVVFCGAMSQACGEEANVDGGRSSGIKARKLRVRHMAVHSYLKKFPEAFKVLSHWIREGKLEVREHRTEGFCNMPKAFIELFHGANIGKAIVKV